MAKYFSSILLWKITQKLIRKSSLKYETYELSVLRKWSQRMIHESSMAFIIILEPLTPVTSEFFFRWAAACNCLGIGNLDFMCKRFIQFLSVFLGILLKKSNNFFQNCVSTRYLTCKFAQLWKFKTDLNFISNAARGRALTYKYCDHSSRLVEHYRARSHHTVELDYLWNKSLTFAKAF